MADSMLQTLDHVVIAARDLAAASRDYARLLARPLAWRGRHPGLGTANALFRLDNTYLELLAPVGEGPVAERVERRLAGEGEGLFALALGTDDASECAELLRRRGLPAGDPVDGGGREETTGRERRWRNVFVPSDATRGVWLFAIQHLSPADRLPAGEPSAGRDAVARALDHVVVTTSDPDDAIVLYRDRLGLRLALDRRFEQRGVRLVFFRLGGVTVELAAGLTGSAAGGPDRLWGLAYRVADVDAARRRLAEDGFDVSGVRAGNKPGTRVCTVRNRTCGVATLLIGPG
jgi:catechol 2,3-dioxygenase-like lactoylglutathione lyase family enzyme